MLLFPKFSAELSQTICQIKLPLRYAGYTLFIGDLPNMKQFMALLKVRLYDFGLTCQIEKQMPKVPGPLFTLTHSVTVSVPAAPKWTP